MNETEKLIVFIKEQIRIENKIVDSLNQVLPNIENLAVESALKGISLDSMKHAHMFNSAMSLLTQVSKALDEKNLNKQRELVQRHIDLELRLIKRITAELPKVENEKVKLLLEAILFDEKRHHMLLNQLLDTLVAGETITEEEWLDLIWKSTPFHGAPGG